MSPESLSVSLDRAGAAVEIWALMAGKYDRDKSRLTLGLPYPSTLYSALGDAPEEVVWEAINDLKKLAAYWESVRKGDV